MTIPLWNLLWLQKTPPKWCRVSSNCLAGVMRSLARKPSPLHQLLQPFGVEYDLANLTNAFFTVGNKPERLLRIERLIGLLNFASGFALGKALQPAAQGFSSLATGVELQPAVFADLCEHALTILRSLRPRKVATSDDPLPIIVYTDGAFGEDLADWEPSLLTRLHKPGSALLARCLSFYWKLGAAWWVNNSYVKLRCTRFCASAGRRGTFCMDAVQFFSLTMNPADIA